MPIPYQYPVEQWSRRKLRTQADLKLAADIQRRSQSQVRGWNEEHDTGVGEKPVSKDDWRNSHEQRQ
jgi:hypothetical protein